VHLGPVQGQPVGESHGVLLWGVARADPQHLGVKEGGGKMERPRKRGGRI
jgi:hypothetical protein